jgi:hypothetical protein
MHLWEEPALGVVLRRAVPPPGRPRQPVGVMNRR